jgi:hypothetical protein
MLAYRLRVFGQVRLIDISVVRLYAFDATTAGFKCILYHHEPVSTQAQLLTKPYLMFNVFRLFAYRGPIILVSNLATHAT